MSAAQASLDGGRPLELILLSPETEAGSAQQFWRIASDDHPDPLFRPQLVVTFAPAEVAVPEPTSLTLLGVGGVVAGLAGYSRRTRRCT